METLTEAMERVKGHTPLKAYCDAHLEARGRETYVCPKCGSGNGPRRTAAFHLYGGGERWKCSACEAGGDVFDLAGIIGGTEDRAEQCDAVAAWAGVEGWRRPTEAEENAPLVLGQTIRDDRAPARGRAYGWDDVVATADEPTETRADQITDAGQAGEAHQAEEEATDFTAFYEQAHRDLMRSGEALAYLHSRGITDETAERLRIGYVASWTHPKDGKHHTKRLILPRTAQTYTARAIDETERDYSPEYKKQVVGHQTDLFNLKAAEGAAVVVVVEGELDAASIWQATGRAAVGIGSISNAGSFAERAKEVAPRATWLVALDNDRPSESGRNPGADAQKRLMDGMAAAGLRCVALDGAELFDGHKDANEALVANPSHLKATLDRIVADLEESAWDERMRLYDVLPTFEIMSDLHELADGRAPISTGFKMLDNVLGGGLHAKSLHVIGAQSSEGKTTISLQIGDHVAASGHHVLFCTVEQRASELMAKSLARMARQANGGKTILTAREVTNPAARKSWSAEKWAALNAACERYNATVTPFMHFMDPDEPPTVRRIWECATAICERYGEAPVLIIDYLQLLAPEAGHERDSDKQVTDHNVTLLRRLAGRLNTPVWVVAALNRQSYNGPISTDSFRESSSIEYSADILMGLEPFDLPTRWHNEGEKRRTWLANVMHDRTRRATKRWMDLQVLKNRFGGLPDDGLPFVYHADADTFETVWRVTREKRAEDDGDVLHGWDGAPLGGGEDDGDVLVM